MFPSCCVTEHRAYNCTLQPHRVALLYSHATLSTITSDWLWHPADPPRDHQRKVCSFKVGCEPSGIQELQCHRTLSHLSYLWHCCGYILFAALVSEVWEPPSPVTPTVTHRPTLPPTHRHCNLVLSGLAGAMGDEILCRQCAFEGLAMATRCDH